MTSDFLLDVQAQPALLHDALTTHVAAQSPVLAAAAYVQAHRHQRIVITGMGSSFYSAYPAVLQLLAAGYAVQHVELSELLHFAAGTLTKETILIVISQSGETVEAVRLLRDATPQSTIIALTNNPNSTVAQAARFVMPHLAGAEKAVATKTYTTSLLALGVFVRAVLGMTPAAIATALTPSIDAMQRLNETFVADELPALWRSWGAVTFVGRGPSYASALAGSLLYKETARMPADALSSAQFRHGPLEIAGPRLKAIICAGPGATLGYDVRLADELHSYGSSVWLIGPVSEPKPYPVTVLPALAYAPLAEIIPLQHAARALAVAEGLNPGEFAHIGKVTDSE
jgi:glucosamine--fructose-6-phosphate aminotransferase (isomerizing)